MSQEPSIVFFNSSRNIYNKKKLSAQINAKMKAREELVYPKFRGTVVDTGAARSCIGYNQAKALWKLQGFKSQIEPSNILFKFGDVVHCSNKIMNLSIPTPNGNELNFKCNIVNADVPLLLGLDVLKRENLIVNVRDLKHEHMDSKLPMKIHKNHLIVPLVDEIFYSKVQLLKLYRHCRHPGAEKLYRLLKRIDPTNVQGNTLEALKEIQSKCEPCSVISRRQLSFQVGNVKEEELVFNKEISMDLFKIDGKYVLHIIDTDTHFSAARFLNNRMNVDDVWDAFLIC